MRLRLISACAALSCLAPAVANATGSEASGFTWTGMYVGINGGYGMGTSDWDMGSSGSNTKDIDGTLVGLKAGYNAQLANGLVAGVELSTAGTGISGKSGCSGSSCSSSFKSLSDLSGRLGVNMGGSMVFGKAGIAYETSQNSITTAGVETKDSGGSLGYVVGGGFEFYIDHNITTNVEYNYYSFSSDTSRVGATDIDNDLSASVLKAGFNLKFN